MKSGFGELELAEGKREIGLIPVVDPVEENHWLKKTVVTATCAGPTIVVGSLAFAFMNPWLFGISLITSTIWAISPANPWNATAQKKRNLTMQRKAMFKYIIAARRKSVMEGNIEDPLIRYSNLVGRSERQLYNVISKTITLQFLESNKAQYVQIDDCDELNLFYSQSSVSYSFTCRGGVISHVSYDTVKVEFENEFNRAFRSNDMNIKEVISRIGYGRQTYSELE